MTHTLEVVPAMAMEPPSIADEEADFQNKVQEVEAWFQSPRFKGLQRPYSARDVVSKRGSLPVSELQFSNIQARKLFAIFSRAAAQGLPVHTMGAIDPVQMTQMAPHQQVVYISGWAASSVLTTAMNEVGPDLADYPYTTVPNQVQRIAKAQQLHDRKHYDERIHDRPDLRSLTRELTDAERRGESPEALSAIEADWMSKVELVTFDEAVLRAIERNSSNSLEQKTLWQSYVDATKQSDLSVYDRRRIARDITEQTIAWDWDLPRTREGYYHYRGGLSAALKRVLCYSPYADMLWLETKTPDLAEARQFAQQIHEVYPQKWLVYNLSPSFNWSAHGFSDHDLKNFIWDLAKSGFVLQLVSLAGLHSGATITHELASRFKDDGMLAYVELVQRREKANGCDVLTHQKWSGASYVDRILQVISAGSSATLASGADSTENQFTSSGSH